MKLLMLVMGMVVAAGLALVSPALAASDPATIIGGACSNVGFLAGCAPGSQQLDAGPKGSFLQQAANVFLFAAGIVALIFLIIGGVRYITSTGDAGRIQSAKDTMLYAIIGLIVTVLAVPIAGFVIKAAGG
ncbi:MAG TPA: hypothetical protein VMR98_01740 [Candidatus Polarisedimenticolaceae bacterium]|nr:hypothetical protein [Candidatus Polarisedimenticolaceae bacterium]